MCGELFGTVMWNEICEEVTHPNFDKSGFYSWLSVQSYWLFIISVFAITLFYCIQFYLIRYLHVLLHILQIICTWTPILQTSTVTRIRTTAGTLLTPARGKTNRVQGCKGMDISTRLSTTISHIMRIINCTTQTFQYNLQY